MPSTISAVVAARVPNRDVDALHRAADRNGVTTSALIARLIHENLHRLECEHAAPIGRPSAA